MSTAACGTWLLCHSALYRGAKVSCSMLCLVVHQSTGWLQSMLPAGASGKESVLLITIQCCLLPAHLIPNPHGNAQAADERQMVAREVSASRLHSNTNTSTSGGTSGGPANPSHQLPPPPHAAAVGLRHTSSSGSGSGSFGADDIGLQRASSMNLPKPEDSGVPATHPDMCILRIRRNHLVEVRASFLPGQASWHALSEAVGYCCDVTACIRPQLTEMTCLFG